MQQSIQLAYIQACSGQIMCPYTSCILITAFVTPMVFVLFQICLHGGGGGGGGGCMLLHPTPTCANTGPDLQLKLALVVFSFH